MATRLARRRPGVRFEVPAVETEPTLPRMDVAAFVGFAAAGPLDLPVPVEDVARFREIFGGDIPIARDDQGRIITSQLGSSVEAFFGNGGRRAWIVRVADTDEDAPTTGRFAVPGLYDVAGDGWVELVARSPGPWADALAASAHLERVRLRSRLVGTQLPVAPGDDVMVGDLLRIDVGAAPATAYGWFAVTAIEDAVATIADLGAWYEPATITGPIQTSRGGSTPTSIVAGPDGRTRLTFDAIDGVRAGDLLRAGTARALAISARLDTPVNGRDGLPALVPADSTWTVETSPWLRPRSPLSPDATSRVSVVRIGLRVARFNGEVDRDALTPAPFAALGGLGVRETHARWIGALPDDHALFVSASSELGTPLDPAWVARVSLPRFPLAAAFPAGRDVIPLGLGGPEAPAVYGFAPPSAGARLELEGLTQLQSRLFVDTRYTSDSVYALGGALDAAFYTARPRDGSTPRGLHALWPVHEATLVAVPDAVHPAWGPPDPTAPALELDPPTLTFTAPRLDWTEVLAARSPPPTVLYRLQRRDHVQHAWSTLTGPVTTRTFVPTPPEDCAPWAWFRVRAEVGPVHSAWSNEVMLRRTGQDFEPCDDQTIPATTLAVVIGPGGEPMLEFAGRAGLTYVLEASANRELAAPRTLFVGPATGVLRVPVPLGIRRRTWFQVRPAEGGRAGPASNVVAWPLVEPFETPTVFEDPTRYATGTRDTVLILVQRALLRFAAARRDRSALLSVPAHYDVDDAIEHRDLLLRGLRDRESEVLERHGALYRPWLYFDGDTPHAPDGAVAGMIAKRTIDRGAWIAPANVPLIGVTGLALPTSLDQAAKAWSRGVVTIEAAPRGYLPIAARTLAIAPSEEDFSVVRLDILVRRLVEREGARYTFEPNGPVLSRIVHDDLAHLMAGMWRRGAFAGETPSEAFQVIADDRLNPARERDVGRFTVELKYAPSRPLEFVTVRLVESGRGGLVTEGASA